MPAPGLGRRHFVAGVGVVVSGAGRAAERPWRVAFANANETPGVRLEGLGFTGADVRRSFELAARTLPIDIIYYDNAGDAETAVSNAVDAIGQKVDLLIEYSSETSANPEVARRAQQAGVPVLAVGYAVGDAPLYTADNLAAGRIAGRALGAFAKQSWPDDTPLAVVIGDVSDPEDTVALRLKGIAEGLRGELPYVDAVLLDTGGQYQRGDGLLAKFLMQQPRRKVLVAALDDPTALSARAAVEVAVRVNDCVIVGQGLDRSVHGGASEKKEIDPANRASVVLGSVAYYMDRYGYEVLPLALRMLKGESVPARTVTRHLLVTGGNVFREYPPMDMN
jgi:ribose transport system substrate-binding protein